MHKTLLLLSYKFVLQVTNPNSSWWRIRWRYATTTLARNLGWHEGHCSLLWRDSRSGSVRDAPFHQTALSSHCPPSQCVLNTLEFFFIVCNSLLLSASATDLVLLGLQGYLSLVLSQSCLGGECLVDILECRGIPLFRPFPFLEDSSGHLNSYESEYRLTRV